MRSDALEHYGVSPLRLAGVGGALSSAAVAGAWLVTGGVLGQAGPEVMLVLGALVFYIVCSTPRRLQDRERIAQARESVLLSASAKACLGATGSKSKALAVLHPRDPSLAAAVTDAERRVLLGIRVEEALEEASRKLSSYSAESTLQGIARLRSAAFDGGDEETRGLTSSGELSRETKLPMFMTVCFFAPIMLLLYAVFARVYDPVSLSELAALEFILVDVAFYLSAPDRGPR